MEGKPIVGAVVAPAGDPRSSLLQVGSDAEGRFEIAGMPPDVPRWLTEGFAYLHSSDFSWARATTLMGAVICGWV